MRTSKRPEAGEGGALGTAERRWGGHAMNEHVGILALKYLAIKYALTALVLAFVGNRFYDSVLRDSSGMSDGLSKAGAYGFYVLIFILVMTALCFLLYYGVFKGIVPKAYIPFVLVLVVDFVIHWKLFSPASLIPPAIGIASGILLSLYMPYRASIWTST